MFVTLQFRSITNLVCLSAAAIPQLITEHCGPTLESADHARWFGVHVLTSHYIYLISFLIRLLACAAQSPVKV